MREWTHMDKSTWGDGSWQHEPDKRQWVDKATGLDCLIVRNHGGALCGYVGVPEGHPAFEVGYDDLGSIDVHGGLTFSDLCDEEAKEGHGICHIPEPGRPERVWWLGFDTAHSGDLCPAYMRDPWMGPNDVYRDLAYVTGEVESLARQIQTRS